MKRLYQLSLLLLALLLPTSAHAQVKIDGIYYNFLYSSVYGLLAEVISGEDPYSGDVTIPEKVTYDGTNYYVKVIGDYAFSECSGLTSVTMPNSIKSIESYAFNGCNGLKNIIIPNSVESIGTYAFYNCSAITSIAIPDSVYSIGRYAFQKCSALDTLYFNAISCIFGSGIFYSPFFGLNISSIIIGDNVQCIPNYFACCCDNLTSISIPNSVTIIGDEAFSNCHYLANVDLSNSIISIGKEAFTQCFALTNISIPNSVTSIGEGAFSCCDALTSIDIPSSVTSIGKQAFLNCYALTKVNITDISAWCNISFADFEANPLRNSLFINGIEATNLVIPNSVTSINDYAFHRFYSLKSVIIPESVTSIGISSFSYCDSLTCITISNSLTSIGNRAFFGCNSLKSINIPNSVLTIGNEAFRDCWSLKSIEIPNSVTFIGESAFNSCGSLASVKIGNAVTNIGDYAFRYCNNLRHVTWDAVNCTTIGYYAFYDRYESIPVPSLRFGDIVQYIPQGLPMLNMRDQTLFIPNSVKTIDTYAIHGYCAAVVIGNGLENIVAGTFPSDISIAYATSTEPLPCEPGAFANPQTLYVPVGSKIKYFTAPGWSEFANIIEGEYNAATTIELDRDSVTLYKESSLQLLASVLPNSATDTSVGWYSLNSGVASVSNNGVITANGVGETDIIVWIDQVSDTCHVKVTPIMVESIALSANHLSMALNETYTLTANAYPGNAENRTLEWIIPENDMLLTQEVTGTSLNIGAIGEGTVTITVRATDGSGVSASCEIFVSANTPIKNLTLSPETLNLYVGYSEQLNAIITPQDAYIQDLRWFSNNENVVTVDNNGRATGRGVGNATITAFTTDGSNLSATCAITVTNIPVESVTLNYSDLELYEGNSTYLYATVLPSNAMNKTLRWESSNPRVATVSSNGRVNALEVGTTIITATSTDGTDISAACRITVRNYTSSNCFSMPDTAVLHGESVTIPVRLTNDQNILAFQTNIYLPEGFIMATDENNEFLITPSSRLTSNHVIMADRLGDGGVRVICYTPQETPICGYEGDLFYITVTAPEHAAHDYAINLRNSLLTNTDYQELTIPDAGAVLTVETYMMGDVNDSHSVTVTDIVVTAQHVLGRNPSPFIFEAADMNGDENVTVTDIMLIAYLINHPTMNAPRRIPALMNVGDLMSGEDVTLMDGETRTVSIALDNMTDYTAFQLDLTLPDGLTASNFQLTDRAGGHALDVNTMGNGKTRALCYSPAIEAISGHEGALLTFDVTATGEIEGIITVDGIEMVTADYQTVLLDAFTIDVNNATSVNEIAGAKAVLRIEYFNLAGQQIDRPNSGVTLVVTTYTDGTRSTTKVIK